MTGVKETKRLKLGIIFNFSANWMGGVIYVINIVKTLNSLNEDEKPEIFVFYNPELKKFLNEFNYPYIHLIEWKFPPLVKGLVQSFIKRKNLFVDPVLAAYPLDALFPIHNFPVRTRTSVRLISWWADLQHKHYPEFFSGMQILSRNVRIRLIMRNCDHLVLSSHDVHQDFARFFPIRKGLQIHVYHFISIIDNRGSDQIHELKEKYRLPGEYFIVSNQFHRHKNHKILLLALAHLKRNGIIKYLAITGKPPEASDSPYISELYHIIHEHNLQEQVLMLGVLSRNEQLQIMTHAQAVIQPSLFEGWSTVIEDAKSLQVPVIAADLPVNREQLGNTGIYFDPHNPEELAGLLSNYPARDIMQTFYEPYDERIRKAAGELIGIFRP